MTPDSELLVAWVRDEDSAAGDQLISRYFGRVRRFFATKVNPSDVEDMVQRTFAACIEHVARFRAESTFATYIFSIARRQLYRYFRDAYRDTQRHDVDMGVSSIRTLGQSPSSVVAQGENHRILLQALQSLPVEQQTILELHYWDGLGATELASVLEIQPGAARTRLHRARRVLRDAVVVLAGRDCTQDDVEGAARALGRLV